MSQFASMEVYKVEIERSIGRPVAGLLKEETIQTLWRAGVAVSSAVLVCGAFSRTPPADLEDPEDPEDPEEDGEAEKPGPEGEGVAGAIAEPSGIDWSKVERIDGDPEPDFEEDDDPDNGDEEGGEDEEEEEGDEDEEEGEEEGDGDEAPRFPDEDVVRDAYNRAEGCRDADPAPAVARLLDLFNATPEDEPAAARALQVGDVARLNDLAIYLASVAAFETAAEFLGGANAGAFSREYALTFGDIYQEAGYMPEADRPETLQGLRDAITKACDSVRGHVTRLVRHWLAGSRGDDSWIVNTDWESAEGLVADLDEICDSTHYHVYISEALRENIRPVGEEAA